MKKRKIKEALKEADKPMSVEELSNKTDTQVHNLRVDLFRLQEEGEVESIEEEGEIRWKLNVSSPAEKKYDKMSKTAHSD